MATSFFGDGHRRSLKPWEVTGLMGMVWDPQEFYKTLRCEDVFFPGDFGRKNRTGSVGFMKFGFGWEFLGFFPGKNAPKWMKLTASLPLTNWWLEDKIKFPFWVSAYLRHSMYGIYVNDIYPESIWGPYDHLKWTYNPWPLFGRCHGVVGPCQELTGRGPPSNRWTLSDPRNPSNKTGYEMYEFWWAVTWAFELSPGGPTRNGPMRRGAILVCERSPLK